MAIGLWNTLHYKKIAGVEQIKAALDMDREEFEATQKDEGECEELAAVIMAATQRPRVDEAHASRS